MRPSIIPIVAIALFLSACSTTKRLTGKTVSASGRAIQSSSRTVSEATEKLSFWKKPKHAYAPEAPREFRAAWVATVANIDWPSKPALPVAKQVQEIHAILDQAVYLNLNAIILQVRPAADALYASDLEPWSEYLTGEQGLSPAPYYDPLATWVTEAHRRGLELHAWFNPYRARHVAAKSPNTSTHVSITMPDAVRKFNGWEWLDPADPRASQHTMNVVLDVVRRYNIDGVHLDDYFYPYPDYLKNADFPDHATWQRYQQSGGQLSRADWRRQNVNNMIRDLYTSIKATKAHVKFGISPFGIARPGVPESVESSFDQYEKLYADAQLWLNEGWLDYWTPQLYWRIESKQPFDKLLAWWVSQNTYLRHMWPGLITSSANKSDTGWSAEEIIKQIEVTRTTPGVSGQVHFSMIALMTNRAGVAEALKRGPYAAPAIIPASPWLAPGATPFSRDPKGGASRIQRPSPPMVQADLHQDGSILLSWTNHDLDPPTWWGVWARSAGKWQFTAYPRSIQSISIRPGAAGPIEAVSVTAYDRLGIASPPSPAVEIIPRKKKGWF